MSALLFIFKIALLWTNCLGRYDSSCPGEQSPPYTFALDWTHAESRLCDASKPLLQNVTSSRTVGPWENFLYETFTNVMAQFGTQVFRMVSTVFTVHDHVENKILVPRNPTVLDNWVRAELRFADTLQAFLKEDPDFLRDEPILEEYWHDFMSTLAHLRGYDPQAALEERVAAVSWNPMSTFRMTFRVVHILWKLVVDFPHGYLEDMDVNLIDLFPKPWLKDKDLNEAVFSLLLVTFQYNYPPEKVAEGFLGEVATGVEFNSAHCYHIAFHAMRISYYDSAVEWSRLALRKLQKDGKIDESMGVELLRMAVKKHDKVFERSKHLYPNLYVNQLNTSEVRAKARRRRRNVDEHVSNESQLDVDEVESLPAFLRRLDDAKRRRDVYEKLYMGKYNEPHFNQINAWVLCSKGDDQRAAEKAKLFCWNEFRIHPYWLIGPLKMEFLSQNPDIVQMYQVIGPRVIEKLLNNVRDRLEFSSSSKGVHWLGGWIKELDFPDFQSLPRTAEFMTGLHMRPMHSSEWSGIEVATYTAGGYSQYHTDAVVQDDEQSKICGNRIATVLYYLGEPEFGGYTAFIQAKVAARPVEGSAVLSFGTQRNGEVDYDTYHGSCPIIMGRKWVGNKFVRYYEQFLVAKCGLDIKDRFRVAVNGKAQRH